ncbi:unnamed protein product [Rangifer tarandus platyrhynchus]|uniref:Uncharacterized protein n=3 Tax=Rangifer tarandus platyrhynchus TaxID=3082113 RepID=A0AC59ZQK9_RANTA|nr:unnamed protein product [Rangifer tarandus platyrhynchus]CAI9707617.1 unnamed protein product [Rangifer tarandus platyrhynchus]
MRTEIRFHYVLLRTMLDSHHWAGQRALGRPPASPPAFLPSPGQALLPARPVLHPCVLPPATASAVSAAFPSPASRGQFLHAPCLLSDSALSGPSFHCPESALRTGGLHPRPSAFEDQSRTPSHRLPPLMRQPPHPSPASSMALRTQNHLQRTALQTEAGLVGRGLEKLTRIPTVQGGPGPKTEHPPHPASSAAASW